VLGQLVRPDCVDEDADDDYAHDGAEDAGYQTRDAYFAGVVKLRGWSLARREFLACGWS
jgi:hypothetical protein